MWLVAPIWVAAAIAIAVVVYLQLRAVAVPRPGPNGGPAPRDSLDVIKTTITVAGFVGAVLVGVYGYRKQRLIEGDARRADAVQLSQRYATAAEQLGHEKAAVRLAGVYAMAQLADDWDDQRQVCINVLCAYLRMPYESDAASEKYREGEREVRHTIIRVIRDHLQEPSVPTTWCGRDLDFRNATFDGGDLRDVKFTDGKVSFESVKFTGTVSFDSAEFVGGTVSFVGAEFTCDRVSFEFAKFAGGEIRFTYAEFTGGEISFDCATFTGSSLFFMSAQFTGVAISFDEAEYSGRGSVSIAAAKFTECSISLGPFEPPKKSA